MSSTKSKDCFRDAIGSTPGFKVGEIEVGELKFTPPPNVDDARGKSSSQWKLRPVQPRGCHLVYADIVYLRKGNIVGSLTTSDVLSPLDDALRAHLVQTVARRMAESAP